MNIYRFMSVIAIGEDNGNRLCIRSEFTSIFLHYVLKTCEVEINQANILKGIKA